MDVKQLNADVMIGDVLENVKFSPNHYDWRIIEFNLDFNIDYR